MLLDLEAIYAELLDFWNHPERHGGVVDVVSEVHGGHQGSDGQTLLNDGGPQERIEAHRSPNVVGWGLFG